MPVRLRLGTGSPVSSIAVYEEGPWLPGLEEAAELQKWGWGLGKAKASGICPRVPGDGCFHHGCLDRLPLPWKPNRAGAAPLPRALYGGWLAPPPPPATQNAVTPKIQ